LRKLFRFATIAAIAIGAVSFASMSQALTVNRAVSAPKALSAAASNQAVVLTWAKSQGSAKYKITGYQVTTTASAFKTTKTVAASATTLRVTGLTNGVTYKFALQAISGKLASVAVSVSAAPKRPLSANSILFSQPAQMLTTSEDQPLVALTQGVDAIFASLTPEVCSVIGLNLHAIAAGDCVVEATSPANDHYKAATPVQKHVAITLAPSLGNMSLLWSDEFSGAANAAPDSSSWTSDSTDGCPAPWQNCGWGNSEKEYYLPGQNTTDGSADGILNIVANRQTNATNHECYYGRCQWVSGKMTTYGKVAFTYGYIEARIKVPAGNGTWPAFWMLGTNISSTPWPACGELDIMEEVGRFPYTDYGTAHFADAAGAHASLGGTKHMNDVLSAGYHRYGMLWKPDSVTFLIDDQIVYIANRADTSLAHWPFGPDDQGTDPSFYLILNLAMGGNFGGDIDAGLNSATMNVDYVRYYSVDGLGKVTK
jgi:beta-glucanase (GH16 family)